MNKRKRNHSRRQRKSAYLAARARWLAPYDKYAVQLRDEILRHLSSSNHTVMELTSMIDWYDAEYQINYEMFRLLRLGSVYIAAGKFATEADWIFCKFNKGKGL